MKNQLKLRSKNRFETNSLRNRNVGGKNELARGNYFLASLIGSSGVDEPDVMNALGELGTMLLEPRSLPAGTKTRYRCPDWQWRTTGMPREALVGALPEPDYKGKHAVSYFLTAPRPAGQRGGGCPEVIFYFKND